MRIRSIVLALGLLAATVTAASASAANLRSSSGCPAQVVEQPFKRWLDPANYFLAQGGSMEAGTPGWQLKGSSVVGGSESFFVHAAGESKSLAIPSGASATTPPICVSLNNPSLRFFVRNTGSPIGVLAVEAITKTPLGLTVTLPAGVAVAGQAWTPTLPMPFLTNALALLAKDGALTVSFRFTSTLGGNFQIDDVYVDPYRSV